MFGRFPIFGVMVLLCSSSLSIKAAENPSKESLLAINKALNAVRNDNEACKNKVLSGLKDARDILELIRNQPTVEGYTKAHRAVEDVLDVSAGLCTSATQQNLQDTLAMVKKGLDSLAETALAPSPADKMLQEKRQCWNYQNDWNHVDPGCHIVKNGNYAIGKMEFEKILGKIQKADDRFAKVTVVERELGYATKKHITCLQMSRILEKLDIDIDRLEATKVVAKWLVDPQNSGKAVTTIADFNIRKDALQVISEANN